MEKEKGNGYFSVLTLDFGFESGNANILFWI